MDIEEKIKEILIELLDKFDADYSKITVTHNQENNNYKVNVNSDNPSLLIGHHGDNIQALQHLLKVLCWKETNENFFISLDIDDYRIRQEENAIALAERKTDFVRKTGRKQTMPPMGPSLRRKIHLHLMGPGFEDIETVSEGEKDDRRIVIKLKN